MSFVKVGNTFFNQKSDGSLLPVADPDTNKALKSGQLGYTSKANTDKLQFASGASLGVQQGGKTIGSVNLTPDQISRVNKNNPSLARNIGLNLVPGSTPTQTQPVSALPSTATTPATSQNGGSDISSMLQGILKNVIEPAAGAENLADLEQRRQALLRKQLLSQPYSKEGEKVLTAGQKLSLMQTRGQQFEPELQALDGEISKIRDNNTSALEKLQAVSLVLDIQEKMSPTVTDNKEAFTQAKTLRQEFVKASGDFVAIRDSYNRILASADNPSAAGDLALIFNYMKMLDPRSTVREGEFANAQNAASIPDRVRAMWNNVMTGERLTPKQRDDFLGRSKDIYNATNNQHDSLVSQYIDLADNFDLDPNNIVLDLDLYDEISGNSKGTSSGAGDNNTQYIEGYGTYVQDGDNWVLQSSSGGTAGKSASVGADDQAYQLAEAIKHHETGGKQVAGASGEKGMYQFLPSTWKKLSSEYNKAFTGDAGSLEMTPENEDAVAQWKVAQLLGKGWSPYEVALIWNTSLGGTEQPKEIKGVNNKGVAYDSVAYANKVTRNLT